MLGKLEQAPNVSVAPGVEARFRVVRGSNAVYLCGTLNAHANVALLDDLLRHRNVFDLTRLSGASWQGVVKLRDYLAKCDRQVSLVGIPRNVYRYLRLMPIANVHITLTETEVETFDPEASAQPGGTVLVALRQLERMAVEQGPIINLTSRKQIVGMAEHLCPRFFQTTESAPPLFRNHWCQLNSDEANFWLNFCHCIDLTLAMGMDRIATARMAMGPTGASLLVRLEALQQATKAVGLPDGGLQLGTLRKLLAELDAALVSCTAAFAPLAEETHHTLRIMQIAGWNEATPNPAAIHGAVGALAQAALALAAGTDQSLKPLAHRFVRFAETLRQTSLVVQPVQSLPPEWRTPSRLTSLRDSLQIMDPLTEDDWEASLSDMERIERDVPFDLEAVLLQIEESLSGYAASQQLLADLVWVDGKITALQAGHCTWQTLRHDLLDRWRERGQNEAFLVQSFHFPALKS